MGRALNSLPTLHVLSAGNECRGKKEKKKHFDTSGRWRFD